MLAVDPPFQGNGIGKKLIEHCLQMTEVQNCHKIALHNAAFMKKATLFYGKLGFERLPELDMEPLNDGIIIHAYIKYL